MNKIDLKYNGNDITFQEVKGSAKVLQDITTLFNTEFGENTFQPQYGVRLFDLILAPPRQISLDERITYIVGKIEKHPAISSLELDVRDEKKDGRRFVMLDFLITLNNNEVIDFQQNILAN